jgi:hypothetical protein
MVGLVSSTNQASEQIVLDEMRRRGAHILSLGESDVEVSFACGISEAVRNVLYLPVAQLMAYERAMARAIRIVRTTLRRWFALKQGDFRQGTVMDQMGIGESGHGVGHGTLCPHRVCRQQPRTGFI